MKVLVTGGAGYIGSVLVGKLLDKCYQVTVLDNFMYGQMPLAHLCTNRRLEIVRGDTRDWRIMGDLMRDHDAVIPLAAIVGAPACDRDRVATESINCTIIAQICDLLSSDQMVVIPNTNSGYGRGGAEVCTEETPLNPISHYGTTKANAEKLVLHSGGVSLRLATVFGMSPRMRLDLLVNDFVHRAVTDRAVVLFEADFRRNYIHIRDVAGAFIHALENYGTMRGAAYNVGLSDANLTKRELCEAIRRRVPDFQVLDAPIGTDPDQRDYIVSNAKIERTGWKATRGLDQGIRELIKGMAMLRSTLHGNV